MLMAIWRRSPACSSHWAGLETVTARFDDPHVEGFVEQADFQRILQAVLLCDQPDFRQTGEFRPLFSGGAQFTHCKTFNQDSKVIQLVEFLKTQRRHQPAEFELDCGFAAEHAA